MVCVGGGRSRLIYVSSTRLIAWMAGVERHANEAYEHYRARGRDTQGRRLSRPPSPYEPPEIPAGKINTSDP